MQKWRKENPAAARAADARRTDERRVLERRARSYVSAYLRRGRIVPPPFCDRCSRRATLSFYHPDPAQRRQLLWLCAADRRAVAAGRFPVVPHWEWPGHVEPLPTAPRWPRFAADAARVDAATVAVARVANLTPGQQREIFAAAFFRGADPNERRSLFGAGLAQLRRGTIAAWEPYGEPQADEVLRAWIRDEHRRWEHERVAAAPRFVTDEDLIAEREIVPRFEARLPRRRGRAFNLDAIGSVPRPPALSPTTPAPPPRPLDESLLEALDADLAEFDRRMEAILARVDAATRPQRTPEPTRDNDDDDIVD